MILYLWISKCVFIKYFKIKHSSLYQEYTILLLKTIFCLFSNDVVELQLIEKYT
jgi:hypothetical protein